MSGCDHWERTYWNPADQCYIHVCISCGQERRVGVEQTGLARALREADRERWSATR